MIITQHDSRELLLWDTGSSEPKNLTFRELKGHKGLVRSVAFSADEKHLATAGRDSIIIIWDLSPQPASKVNVIKTTSAVRALVFCSTDTLIVAQDDGSIFMRNINQNENKVLFAPETEKPLCLAWNDSKKILVAGCSNGSLLLFDIFRGNSARPVSHIVHTAGIDLITFNSDFSLMATSGWDKTIRFYNYHEFFELENIVGGAEQIRDLNSRIRSLIFTGDNKLAAGLADKSIRVWETSSEKIARMICDLVKRDMSIAEWNDLVGAEIPYEKSCSRNP
jgi:WD40 repeat protein